MINYSTPHKHYRPRRLCLSCYSAGVANTETRARVTKVTVYRHFENKDALFSAALQSLFDALPTPQRVVFQEQGSLRTRLIGVGDNLLRLGTGPLMMRLHRMLSLPRESASDTAEQLWERNFQPYHEAVRHLLMLERKTGTLKQVQKDAPRLEHPDSRLRQA